MSSRREIAIRVDSGVQHVSLVGGAVRGICVAAGADEETCAALELCVVEAVTNTVRHAYRDGPGVIEVVLALDRDWLTAEVRDRGEPMDPQLLDDARDPDPLAESGRGLAIVKRTADEVRYRPGESWNALTIRKRILAKAPVGA